MLPVILTIETSTNMCSVALSKGEQLLSLKESKDEKAHGKLLTGFIEEILKDAGLSFDELDALAVGKGPGSYTGLRLGVSVAKGICYAKDLPLIALNTLEVLSSGALEVIAETNLKLADNDLLCPMIDARRMEVYTAIYSPKLEQKENVEAKIIDTDSFQDCFEKHRIFFFGNGASKTKDILRNSQAVFIEEVYPSAKYMISLALKAFERREFENIAYFEPYYLKEFITTKSKKKLL